MIFFFTTLVFMQIGRKLGWKLSRTILYFSPSSVYVPLCFIWGIAISTAVYGLIDWQQPGWLLRWIMGYALGCYVAIPNFGLIDEGTIPPHAQQRHSNIIAIPAVVYIATSTALTYLFPHVSRLATNT